MNDGIVIRFDDGKCAFYSSAILYGALSQCEELDELDFYW